MRKHINMYILSPNIYMHTQTDRWSKRRATRANQHDKVRNWEWKEGTRREK